MKRQIRRSIFETNSSSVHTITIIKDSDFQKWKRGEIYGRLKGEKGHMDNKLYYLEFSSDKESCEKENLEKLQKLAKFYIDYIEKNKRPVLGRLEEELEAWKEDPLTALKKYKDGVILNGLWATFEDFDETSLFGEEAYDEEQGIHVYFNYYES